MNGEQLYPETTHAVFIIAGIPESIKIDSERYKELMKLGRIGYTVGSEDECSKVVQRVKNAIEGKK